MSGRYINVCEQVKKLPDNELFALLREMEEERLKRLKQREKEDWKVVVDALAHFMDKWGAVSVMRKGDQPCNAINIRAGDMISPDIGEIEVVT